MIDDDNSYRKTRYIQRRLKKILDKSAIRDESATIWVSAENLSDVFKNYFELCSIKEAEAAFAQKITLTCDVSTKEVGFNIAEIISLSKAELDERKLISLLKEYYRK